MPLNHYVTLGRSGLRVSPFCLGAMTFGEDLGWGTSVKDSEAILDRLIELGGTSSTPRMSTPKVIRRRSSGTTSAGTRTSATGW